jgi:hypothetical protein
MFKKNDGHLLPSVFDTVAALPAAYQQRLDESWAGTFYRDFFCRIDEEPFAVLYSDLASRPNTPVNELIGLEVLKAGHGWSDEEMYNHFCFDIQVRYALGLRSLLPVGLTLRTVYNFRQALREHMEQTGEDLFGSAIEHITDEQIAAYGLKTDQQRMDSFQISSNIRRLSRIALLVTVLQRVWRMLSVADQERVAAEFAPYVRGTAQRFCYRLKDDEAQTALERLGQLMQRLVAELREPYGHEETYAQLARVYAEQFVTVAAPPTDPTPPADAPSAGDSPPTAPRPPAADAAPPAPKVRPRQGDELSAASLQSPDDPEATFRRKQGQDYRGYVCNLTETCHPANPIQLITKTQVAPNVTDDEALLVAALPDLVARTDLHEMSLDGGFNGPDADATAHSHGVTLQYSAIRGGDPGPLAQLLTQLTWLRDDQHQPVALVTPAGQRLDLQPGRKKGRYIVHVPPDVVAAAPERWQTVPLRWLKRTACFALYLQERQIAVAENRQRMQQQRQSGKQLRPAVEATVRSVKHPFPGGKAPVRGQIRLGLMLTASSAMTNIRRLWRYQQTQRARQVTQQGPEKAMVAARSVAALCREGLLLLSWSLKAMFVTERSLSVIPI